MIPFGWSSRKSCAIPPANPTIAPSLGPSMIAINIVTTYISSGRTPRSFTWANTVDCSSNAVTITAESARIRRSTRYPPPPLVCITSTNSRAEKSTAGRTVTNSWRSLVPGITCETWPITRPGGNSPR